MLEWMSPVVAVIRVENHMLSPKISFDTAWVAPVRLDSLQTLLGNRLASVQTFQLRCMSLTYSMSHLRHATSRRHCDPECHTVRILWPRHKQTR
jgi:hypothetical protein